MIEMRKAVTTIGMVAILLLIVVMSSPAAAALNVCRDAPSGAQSEGVDIPISLEVTVDGATWYMVDEIIPSGLTVTDAGGADTTEAGHLKWIVLTGATDTTYTYTVQGLAGTYTFAGEFQIEGMADSEPIDCDTGLEIDGDYHNGDTTSSATTVESPDSGVSTGEVVVTTPVATPTETGTQPVSDEAVTSAPSVTPTESMTPAATSTKKLATKPDVEGIVPGFGALFAVAGLLAVAYMFRRR